MRANRTVEKHTAGKSRYNFNALTGTWILLDFDEAGVFSNTVSASGVKFSISSGLEVEVVGEASSESDILKLKDDFPLEIEVLFLKLVWLVF